MTFWSSTTADPCDAAAGADKSRFRSQEPAAPVPVTLSGLAVTAGHYLVVGVVGQGLLIFDLHRGGPPVLLLWTLPAGQNFAPWDLAATPDGGVLVLDRDNGRYWRLNRHFQLTTTLPGEDDAAGDDLPAQGSAARCRTAPRLPGRAPCRLRPGRAAPSMTRPQAPISIESGPNDSVLVLNAPDAGAAAVYEYVNEGLRAVYPLTYSVTDEDGSTESRDLRAHDFAYLHHTPDNRSAILLQEVEDAKPGEELHLLFVARRDGNQVIAYKLIPAVDGH